MAPLPDLDPPPPPPEDGPHERPGDAAARRASTVRRVATAGALTAVGVFTGLAVSRTSDSPATQPDPASAAQPGDDTSRDGAGGAPAAGTSGSGVDPRFSDGFFSDPGTDPGAGLGGAPAPQFQGGRQSGPPTASGGS